MKADSLSQSSGRRSGRRNPSEIFSAAAAIAAGAALRLWMLHKFFEVNGDSQLYGSIARNILLHSQYANGNQETLQSTLIRLPGYPLYLALCFRLFGMENYFAPACLQVLAELAGCVLLALFAWRIAPGRWRMAAPQATLWLACLCPFTAVYDAEPLTEALTLFCVSLALWAVARFQDRRDWTSALAFTFAVTYSALLRPDGAFLGVALAVPMIRALLRESPATHRKVGAPSLPQHFVARVGRAKLHMGVACLLLALAPFAAWTWRNYRVFHVFQPLAPRYATDPGEETWPGWQRWTKTWCLDFVSTYQVYWNMPGDKLDASLLPDRAFDSPQQRAQTARLFAGYEANGEQLSPALDAGFAQLARERIAAHPLRYYLRLPIGRVLDMTFRPRVENLPIDLDWWVYEHHYAETRFSWFYACLNALYVLLALTGLCMKPRLWQWMAAYIALRCLLLATIEAPEARYTLEFFPFFFVLGGIAIGRLHTGGREEVKK